MRLRLFPSRQTVERRLRVLKASRRLHYAGRVAIEEGRKGTHVCCNRRFAERFLRHETDLMRVFFAYWPAAYALTGTDVDPRWKADMETVIRPPGTGRRYMVEIDEATEGLSQVRQRLAVYGDCPHTVLFVGPSASRAAEALRLTKSPLVYVSSLAACLADLWGRHWRNCLGEPAAVALPLADPVAEGAANPG